MDEVIEDLTALFSGPKIDIENIEIVREVTNKFMALGPAEKQDVFLWLIGRIHARELS